MNNLERIKRHHAEDGMYFLTDLSSPDTGSYYGFLVLTSAAFSSFTYEYTGSYSGSITDVETFPPGYYPIPCTHAVLSKGEIALLKKS